MVVRGGDSVREEEVEEVRGWVGVEGKWVWDCWLWVGGRWRVWKVEWGLREGKLDW